MTTTIIRAGLALLAAACLVSAAPASAQLQINGAGATFPYPIYSKWFDAYVKVDPSVRFNYQSIGSGGGIKQITEQTVDFGASDGPLSDDQLKAAPGHLLHFPTVMGAVVLTYNVAGVSGALKFTPEAIAGIYLGTITKWNDPALTGPNPGAALPNQDIIVIHRSDGSGTTYIFSDYLSKVSLDWQRKVGKGTSVNWPVGLGGKGNEGVTGLVKQSPNSIGYVELIYAISNKLPFAHIKNRAGTFVTPSLESVTAAAAGYAAQMPADFRIVITDAPGAAAYPISGMTWLLVYEQQHDAAKGQKLVQFLDWMMHDGQQYVSQLDYAPLPPELVAKEADALRRITTADGKSLARQ
ncbi:MAG TPA: phosphate ABC transporter substrate-binding protein PstS [Candidatus Binatia bacterium]|nr:phosphate ABC transporter substrate-binding protein PstS [Candidatus Binatia bacterium]